MTETKIQPIDIPQSLELTNGQIASKLINLKQVSHQAIEKFRAYHAAWVSPNYLYPKNSSR